MRADDLKKILDRRPFRPLRLHMSDGSHVDIRHPEPVVVSRSYVLVPEVVSPAGVLEEFEFYGLLHIVRVTRAGRNGGRGRSRR